MDVFGYAERLPAPGETVLGYRLAYAPGGKGGNQAVAAARMGASVRFTGACGRDEFGDRACAALRDDGMESGRLRRVDVATGVALIVVDDAGENQIVAIPGANHSSGAQRRSRAVDVWVVQGEVPLAAVAGALAAARATGATALVTPSPAGRILAAGSWPDSTSPS